MTQDNRDRLERDERAYFDAYFKDKKIGTMPSSVGTVGTTSAQLLAADVDRVYAILVNDSDVKVFLGFGEAAVEGQGARMNAEGGVYEVSWYNLFLGAINGICEGANKNISIVDGRI